MLNTSDIPDFGPFYDDSYDYFKQTKRIIFVQNFYMCPYFVYLKYVSIVRSLFHIKYLTLHHFYTSTIPP